MDLEKIFINNIFNFPIDIDTDDIVVNLRKKYKEYSKHILSLKGKNKYLSITEEKINKINKLEKDVLKILNYYLNGKITSAHLSFTHLIKNIEKEMELFRLENRKKELISFKKLYRMRASDNANLKRKELFHVPYSLRKNIGSYRFSISGLPSIYLGTSSYICWEELSRPSLDDLHISKYKFTEKYDISLLNISFTNKMIIELLKQFPENGFDESIMSKSIIDLINCYIIIWPLIASCQIKVKNSKAPFKPEYIIPQILMQYVVNKEGYDGIVYTSTRVEAKRIDPNKCLNIAIPIKSNKDKTDYCKDLIEKLQLTEPLSIKLYRPTIHKGLGSSEPTDFELVSGLSSHYKLSDFGYIERAVDKIGSDVIKT